MTPPAALRVSFRTFGCKLNQAETESIADAFSLAGAALVPAGQSADVVVFNTCTVTSKAEQKARREMRLALRLNPDAVAIVTGCYAELDPEAVAAVAPRAVVIAGSRKAGLRAMAADLAAARTEGLDLLDEARRLAALASGKVPDPFAFLPGDDLFHARPQLKIQDGCDNSCSYCRVCLARGPSVSLAPDQVLSRVAALAASGVPETVLTGVNLSGYRSGGLDFPGLLETLIGGTRDIAFRISSYEPDRVDGAFARAFASPRVRPHLHLSVQSGSDRVLQAMGRRYGRDDVLRAAAAVREVRGDPFIGADLILGFPGETDDDFRQTVDLMERLEPAWIHAFTFSPRPGTRAYSMKPCVPERIAVERAAVVQALAERNKAAFTARRLGTTLDAVVEFHGAPDPVTGLVHATSSEYLKLAVSGLPPGFRGAFTCSALSAVASGSNGNIPDLRTHYYTRN